MFRFCVLLIAAITMSATASAGFYHHSNYHYSYGAPQVASYGGYGGYGYGGYGYGGYAQPAYGYGGYGIPYGPPVQQYLVPVTYRVPVFIAPPPPCSSGCNSYGQ
ncbi:MAG: hypothetical protein R3C59_14050 [Planctomycetaceae bacterium]